MLDTFINDHPTLVVLIAMFLTVILVFIGSMYDKRIFLKVIESKLDTMHEKRNHDLVGIISTLKQLTESVDYLKKKDAEKDFLRLLRNDIDTATDAVIDQCNNSKFNQIAIDGADLFFEFAETIYKQGLKNFKSKRSVSRAKNLLSRIRSAHIVNNGISDDAAQNIRDLVAYPLIGELMMNFKRLSTGEFNGKTNDKFREYCAEFVYKFLSQSLTHF